MARKTDAFRPLDLPIDPGIETRWGSRVYRVQGIDHDENDWWVRVTFTDNPKIVHEYHPAYLVHDDNDVAAEHFQTISKAIMDMLGDDGQWDDKGRWSAT